MHESAIYCDFVSKSRGADAELLAKFKLKQEAMDDFSFKGMFKCYYTLSGVTHTHTQ